MTALLLAAAIATIPATQTDSVAGSWTADFQGRTFVRLELRTAGDSLTGEISIGDIQVDDQGGLREVGDPPATATPIFDVVQKTSTVTFARKDGDDTDRFELRILAHGRAELQLVPTEELRQELAANGIPMPKPFAMTRQTPSKH
jgi:hypothetical protein